MTPVDHSAFSERDDEIDLARIWMLLYHNRLAILLVTFVAMLGGVTYTWLATPIYQADAMLQVEEKTGSLPGFSEISDIFAVEASAQTEIEILRSRMVLGSVIDELALDIVIRPWPSLLQRQPLNQVHFSGWQHDGKIVHIEHFDVPRKLLNKPFQLVYDGKGAFTLRYEENPVLRGQVGAAVSAMDSQLSIKLSRFDAEQGDVFQLIRLSRPSAIAAIQKRLGVSEKGKSTGILSISLTGEHPGRVQDITDSIARNYLLQNVQRMSAEAERSLEFLDQQLPEIRQNLTDAEEQLNAYRLKAESVDLSLETKLVLDRMVALESRLNELEFRESEVSRLYTMEHPTYRTLLDQKASIDAEISRLDARVRDLPETQQEILRLSRDVQLNQEIYIQLLNRAQELRIVRAGTVGNVRIIDGAMVRPEPVKPRGSLIVALSVVLGFMASAGVVLLRAAFNRKIESPEELEQAGLAVYATVPMSETQRRIEDGGKRQVRRGSGKRFVVPLLAMEEPHDLAVEAIRSLRTSLHFAMLEARNSVLMISGPGPSVGKTFITVNLAVTLAQAGQRVVVIDSDLRKGHMHRYFNENAGTGLADYLAGKAGLEQVLHDTSVPNLRYISLGTRPPNPAELLMRPEMGTLLKRLSEENDLVLVDTPPVLAVTDAAIIGQFAGTTLLVARFGENTLSEVEQTVRRFSHNGIQVKGCILNFIEKRASNYYSYYAYDYSSSQSSGRS